MQLCKQELFDEPGGAVALRYIREERKLDPDILRPYDVGFCPPWVRYPHDRKTSLEGHLWYMRGRMIVAIRDQWGSILGFNGRRLDDCEEDLKESLREQFGDAEAVRMTREWMKRKWVNESYTKSHHVFQLDRSRHEILRSGYALVVEGCMDAIVLDAYGFKNSVSLLGTSMDIIQRSLLKRYTDHLVFCFDPDAGGDLSAEKAIGPTLEKGQITSCVIRPRGGMDPDEIMLDPTERNLFRWAVEQASARRRSKKVIDLSDESTRLAARLSTR